MEASEKSRTRKRLSQRLGCWQDCREARRLVPGEDWGLRRRGRGSAHRETGLCARAAWFIHPKPPGPRSPSPGHPPPLSLLFSLYSHLRVEMGLRGEGGQNSEQERRAPLVLFSHLRSWQKRAEFSTAPDLTDPSVIRVPEQGFHQLLAVPSRLLQTPWLSHQSGAFLCRLKECSGSGAQGVPLSRPTSACWTLFPGVAEPGPNAKALTEPNILMGSQSLNISPHQLQPQPGNWGHHQVCSRSSDLFSRASTWAGCSGFL